MQLPIPPLPLDPAQLAMDLPLVHSLLVPVMSLGLGAAQQTVEDPVFLDVRLEHSLVPPSPSPKLVTLPLEAALLVPMARLR